MDNEITKIIDSEHLGTFPIHKCVFRNDSETLKKLLTYEDIQKRINEEDNHGNTPIHLAIMLDRRNCILVLIKNGCDVISKNKLGWNITEEATMLGDVDILEKIMKKKYMIYVGKTTDMIKEWTEILPVVYFKFKIRVKSTLSLFKMLGLKDTIEIIKKGNSLRINTTIDGFENHFGMLKIHRGKISLVFKYDETHDCHKIYLIDNKKKCYRNCNPEPPQWFIDILLRTKLDVKTLYKYYFDINNIIVKPKKRALFGKNKNVLKLIDGRSFKTEKYYYDNLTFITRKRENEIIIGDYPSEINTNVLKVVSKKKKKISTKILANKFNNKKGEEERDDEEEDFDDEDDDEFFMDDIDNEKINDDMFLINTEILNDYQERKKAGKVEPSMFESIINENTVKDGKISEETENLLIRYFNEGHDDKGNELTKDDIIYIYLTLPDFFTNAFKRKFETDNLSKRFSYIKQVMKDKKNEGIKYEVFDNNDKGKTEIVELDNKESDDIDLDSVLFDNMKKDEKNKNNEIKKKLDGKKKLTEEEYFDTNNTELLHVGRVMTVNEEYRVLKKLLKVWLTKENEFPINFNHFYPFIKYIYNIIFDMIGPSNLNEQLQKGEHHETFENIIKCNKFPIKYSYAISSVSKIELRTVDCQIDGNKIPDNLFEIPENYTFNENTFYENIR